MQAPFLIFERTVQKLMRIAFANICDIHEYALRLVGIQGIDW